VKTNVQYYHALAVWIKGLDSRLKNGLYQSYSYTALCSDVVGTNCAANSDLWLKSKCYRKFDRQLTWYSASNDCLSRGGSLAVFTDIGRPTDNSQLTGWLSTDKEYWVGLVRSWWKTPDEGRPNVFAFYSVRSLNMFTKCSLM